MILRLGHVEMQVTDLGAARAFYVDALGFIVDHEVPGTMYLRGHEDFERWTLALTQADRPGLDHFAFRVGEPDDLDRLEELHRRLDAPTERVEAGVEPGQGEALRVRTPDGHPVEFFHELEQVPLYENGRVLLPMRRLAPSHGLVPRGIDHVNLRVPDMAASQAYWRDQLGFSVSEAVQSGDELFGAWLRRSSRTHDLAIVTYPRTAFHHFAFALKDPGEIIRAADLLADAGFSDSVEFGPGRHGVTNALFLYTRDPDGNRLELFCGDYLRDHDMPPVIWTMDQFRQGRLWWGHEAPERFAEVVDVRHDWLAQESLADVAAES